MGFAAELAGVLKQDVLLPRENGGVELKDKRSGMKVRVIGLPARCSAVRLERVGHLGKLKDRGAEHEGHLRRICDYLLVVEAGDDIHVVLIELKETWNDDEKPKDQLRRSIPLLDYLRSVCRVEYDWTQDQYRTSVHYSIVCEKISMRLDKRSVRADPTRPVSEEEYKGITIRTFVETSVPFSSMTAE